MQSKVDSLVFHILLRRDIMGNGAATLFTGQEPVSVES